MDFEYDKEKLYNSYVALPHISYIHLFALESLKGVVSGNTHNEIKLVPKTLTENDRKCAEDFLENKKTRTPLPDDFGINFSNTFEEISTPIKIENEKSIELPKNTLNILNECYYEYYIKKKYKDFKKLLVDFEANYEVKFYNQLIEAFEELLDVKILIRKESNKILDLKEAKFKDIINYEMKSNKDYIKYLFERLKSHKNEDLEYKGVKGFKGMSYDTLKGTYNYLNGTNDYSKVSYLLQRLKIENLISKEKNMVFIKWLYDNQLIKKTLYDDIKIKRQILSIEKTAKKTFKPLFDKCLNP